MQLWGITLSCYIAQRRHKKNDGRRLTFVGNSALQLFPVSPSGVELSLFGRLRECWTRK